MLTVPAARRACAQRRAGPGQPGGAHASGTLQGFGVVAERRLIGVRRNLTKLPALLSLPVLQQKQLEDRWRSFGAALCAAAGLSGAAPQQLAVAVAKWVLTQQGCLTCVVSLLHLAEVVTCATLLALLALGIPDYFSPAANAAANAATWRAALRRRASLGAAA